MPSKWLQHAFAVDPPGPAQPDSAQQPIVDALCVEIVRRRLTSPALIALEMSRPLNYVSAQVLHFFQPFLAAVADTAAYDHFTAFLQKRGSVDYLIARLEAADAEALPSPPGTGRDRTSR